MRILFKRLAGVMTPGLLIAGAGSLVLGVVLSLGAGFAAAHEDDDHPEGTVVYYPEVQSIIDRSCVGCHTEGGIGPFPLDDPTIVRVAADSIAREVANRTMPPWMPGPATPALVGDRSLTQAEIDLIVAWEEQGAHMGDEADAIPVEAVTAPPIREDVVLAMPEYSPDPTLDDEYRCFLLDADLPQDRYISSYTVIPGNEAIVHHVLVYQVAETSREQAIAREAEDDRPGWSCFGGPGIDIGAGGGRGADGRISEGGGVAGSIGGWVPGARPVTHPEGTGALLRADGLLVMQVHYHMDNGTGVDQTRFVAELAPADAEIIPLYALNMVAPVEIPCPEGATDPMCDRTTALLADSEEGTGRAVVRSMGLLALCDARVEDYLNQDASQVVSSCDYTVPTDGWAVGVTGHMHELGTVFTITRNPETDLEILFDIPRWDFHWQGSFQYVEPIRLYAGDVIRMTCVWDNSGGDRYIVWGEGTEDEMCLGALTVMPLQEGES